MLSSSSAGGGEQLCRVTEVDAGKLISASFASGSLDTKVTWRLVPEGAGTRVFWELACFDLDSPIGRRVHDGMGARWPDGRTRIGWIVRGPKSCWPALKAGRLDGRVEPSASFRR